jgi:hypothetical protein
VLSRADEPEGAWRVATTMSSPMGEGKDEFLLASNLTPVSRSASQGPATITLEYADDAVTGKLAMGPQEMPVNAGLDAPVWPSEEALNVAFMALPLADDTAISYRTFDFQTQKVRVWSMKVDGRETVETEAGSFETYKLAIEAMDDMGGGQTNWVTVDAPLLTVKVDATLPPQAGGGAINTVLTSISD